MKYKTIIHHRELGHANYAEIRDAFDELVNEALQEGWKPQGGVDVEYLNRGAIEPLIFSIGMVKED